MKLTDMDMIQFHFLREAAEEWQLILPTAWRLDLS